MADPEPVLWRGELARPGALRRRGLALVGPGTLLALLFVAVPSVLMVALAFLSRGPNGEIVAEPTLANWWRLCGFETMGWSLAYVLILLRTLLLAGLATVLAVALAYPLCFAIAKQGPRGRAVLLALVAIPFCTNLVVRTYGWMLLFSSQLPPAKLAQWSGWLSPGQALYPSLFAVYVGMVSSLLPFAALPLYPSVERLDRSLLDAARDLYASRWGVFRHAVLPQTMPGLGAALVLTFIPALGVFLIPDLLGGAKTMLVGNLMQQEFYTSSDLPFGAAVGCALTALTLGALALARLAGWRLGEARA
jgi:spermidine/putrescine transport system permease protein